MRVGIVANTERTRGRASSRSGSRISGPASSCGGVPSQRRSQNSSATSTSSSCSGSDWSVFDPGLVAAAVAAECDLVVHARPRSVARRSGSVSGPDRRVNARSRGHQGRARRDRLGARGERPSEARRGRTVVRLPPLTVGEDRPVHRAFAVNDAGPQAVVERRTLGVQFHPEVTGEVIDRWSCERDLVTVRGGSVPRRDRPGHRRLSDRRSARALRGPGRRVPRRRRVRAAPVTGRPVALPRGRLPASSRQVHRPASSLRPAHSGSYRGQSARPVAISRRAIVTASGQTWPRTIRTTLALLIPDARSKLRPSSGPPSPRRRCVRVACAIATSGSWSGSR